MGITALQGREGRRGSMVIAALQACLPACMALLINMGP